MAVITQPTTPSESGEFRDDPLFPADSAAGLAEATLRDGIRFIAIYCALAALIWMTFGQTVGHPFVNYDDQEYVYENPRITGGLTNQAVIGAFTQFHARNWHPLTTLSHMLDCQLFGLNPAGHHFINVLLHTAAALLLFSLLQSMTGAVWRSFFVAALFAVHPLRAESVAWVAERKDVLSGVFFMLTLCAYVRYARARTGRAYLITLVLFLCGLMSKPMLVTLPVVLLLLDYWPLQRWQPELTQTGVIVRPRLLSLLIEKIPFFIGSISISAATMLAQRQTVAYSGSVPIDARLANALRSCVTYIGQMLWPVNLALFYPDQGDSLTAWSVVCCGLLVTAATLLALLARRNWPWLTTGWFWYLICLLPVIGILKAGIQGRADRYTYLPQVGLSIAIVWSVAQLPLFRLKPGRQCLTAVGTAVIAILAWRAAVQTSYWKSSESLWSHALAVSPDNAVAHYNVAAILLSQGRLDEAITHYQAALASSSPDESHSHFSRAILENAIGNAIAHKGDLDSAAEHYREAIRLRPDFVDARSNLSSMLYREGDVKGAISEYEKVVATPPEEAAAHAGLGDLLMHAGREEEALAQYERARTLASDNPALADKLDAEIRSYRTARLPIAANPADP